LRLDIDKNKNNFYEKKKIKTIFQKTSLAHALICDLLKKTCDFLTFVPSFSFIWKISKKWAFFYRLFGYYRKKLAVLIY